MSYIYFRLNGGLGNQLSQYSAGIFYKNKFNIDIKFDDYYLKKSKKKHEVITLENLFGVTVTVSCLKSKISRFINRLLYKIGLNTIPILGFQFFFEDIHFTYNKNLTTIVEDFWQNNKFYSGEVLKTINNCIKEKIDISNSKFDIIKDMNISKTCVAMHIRRGDYLTNRNLFIRQQFVLPIEYYKNAIKELKLIYQQELNLFVFSDDNISKEIFEDHEVKVIIVDNNIFSDIESFWLYSRFTVCIIANSTFSMWAALISSFLFNSRVYSPYIWHKKRPWDLEILPKNFNVLKF